MRDISRGESSIHNQVLHKARWRSAQPTVWENRLERIRLDDEKKIGGDENDEGRNTERRGKDEKVQTVCLEKSTNQSDRKWSARLAESEM